MLAPLDAMPYWLCQPTSSPSSIPSPVDDGLRLTLRRLDVMAGAMERAMAMGKCLEIQEHHCSRCSTLIQDCLCFFFGHQTSEHDSRGWQSICRGRQPWNVLLILWRPSCCPSRQNLTLSSICSTLSPSCNFHHVLWANLVPPLAFQKWKLPILETKLVIPQGVRASAIANQELICSVSSDDSTLASGMAHHDVWLVLELLLWSFEGQGAEFADMKLKTKGRDDIFGLYTLRYIFLIFWTCKRTKFRPEKMDVHRFHS